MKGKTIVQPGEDIVGVEGHFMALRWLDSEFSINFGNRRHEWEAAVFAAKLKANTLKYLCVFESLAVS